MKKIILFFLVITSISACSTDHYTGEERTVLEGRVTTDLTSVQGLKVTVFPSSFSPESGDIAEIEQHSDQHSRYAISTTTTDKNGNFSLSFPQNEKNDVYYIEIKKDYHTKYYGYISEFNVTNHYINVGTLNFNF